MNSDSGNVFTFGTIFFTGKGRTKTKREVIQDPQTENIKIQGNRVPVEKVKIKSYIFPNMDPLESYTNMQTLALLLEEGKITFEE